jgi:acyl-CoA thioester hydrolase
VAEKGKQVTVQLRVRYAESDQMGVAHYANYLAWFEIGRVELMREVGISYAESERQGFFLPVSEACTRYMAAAHFDELLEVKCRVGEVRTRAVRFEYELLRSGQVIAKGHTVHVCTDREARPVTFPDWMGRAFKKALAAETS